MGLACSSILGQALRKVEFPEFRIFAKIEKRFILYFPKIQNRFAKFRENMTKLTKLTFWVRVRLGASLIHFFKYTREKFASRKRLRTSVVDH